ncbi:MAG: carboxypeptidase-like regulatory domain-containing protein [Chitinophagaceae bacterium]
MKQLIFIILLISSINALFGQSLNLIEQVTDLITNEPLAAASIINKQTNKVYTTDKEGLFTITVAKTGVLNIIISFAGYETTGIFINHENPEKFYLVKLTPTYKAGDEIVISATKRPEKIISALASIQVIKEAIIEIRKHTDKGSINNNTNGSDTKAVKALCEAGLNSIRVSTNSVREEIYTPYYRPNNYNFKDIIKSLKVVKNFWRMDKHKLFCFSRNDR